MLAMIRSLDQCSAEGSIFFGNYDRISIIQAMQKVGFPSIFR